MDQEALRLFFEQDPIHIAADIESAPKNSYAICRRVKKYREIPFAKRSSKQVADYHHDMLLDAHVRTLSSRISEDEALFVAAETAEDVAEAATDFALHSSVRLNEKMREIEKGERQCDSVPGLRDDGPGDDEEFVAEFNVFYRKIYGTIVSDVFRRYGFREYQDLFDNHRLVYEVRHEVGRCTSITCCKCSADANRAGEIYLKNEFGQIAVDMLHERLKRCST